VLFRSPQNPKTPDRDLKKDVEIFYKRSQKV